MTLKNGRFSGVNFRITSKSGTNDFHGSLFFTPTKRIERLQRYNGGNTQPETEISLNSFGQRSAGPIWKNKNLRLLLTMRTVASLIRPPGTGWLRDPAFAALAPSWKHRRTVSLLSRQWCRQTTA